MLTYIIAILGIISAVTALVYIGTSNRIGKQLDDIQRDLDKFRIQESCNRESIDDNKQSLKVIEAKISLNKELINTLCDYSKELNTDIGQILKGIHGMIVTSKINDDDNNNSRDRVLKVIVSKLSRIESSVYKSESNSYKTVDGLATIGDFIADKGEVDSLIHKNLKGIHKIVSKIESNTEHLDYRINKNRENTMKELDDLRYRLSDIKLYLTEEVDAGNEMFTVLEKSIADNSKLVKLMSVHINRDINARNEQHNDLSTHLTGINDQLVAASIANDSQYTSSMDTLTKHLTDIRDGITTSYRELSDEVFKSRDSIIDSETDHYEKALNQICTARDYIATTIKYSDEIRNKQHDEISNSSASRSRDLFEGLNKVGNSILTALKDSDDLFDDNLNKLDSYTAKEIATLSNNVTHFKDDVIKTIIDVGQSMSDHNSVAKKSLDKLHTLINDGNRLVNTTANKFEEVSNLMATNIFKQIALTTDEVKVLKAVIVNSRKDIISQINTTYLATAENITEAKVDIQNTAVEQTTTLKTHVGYEDKGISATAHGIAIHEAITSFINSKALDSFNNSHKLLMDIKESVNKAVGISGDITQECVKVMEVFLDKVSDIKAPLKSINCNNEVCDDCINKLKGTGQLFIDVDTSNDDEANMDDIVNVPVGDDGISENTPYEALQAVKPDSEQVTPESKKVVRKPRKTASVAKVKKRIPNKNDNQLGKT